MDNMTNHDTQAMDKQYGAMNYEEEGETTEHATSQPLIAYYVDKAFTIPA